MHSTALWDVIITCNELNLNDSAWSAELASLLRTGDHDVWRVFLNRKLHEFLRYYSQVSIGFFRLNNLIFGGYWWALSITIVIYPWGFRGHLLNLCSYDKQVAPSLMNFWIATSGANGQMPPARRLHSINRIFSVFVVPIFLYVHLLRFFSFLWSKFYRGLENIPIVFINSHPSSHYRVSFAITLDNKYLLIRL